MNTFNSDNKIESLPPPNPTELITIARYDQIIEAGLIKNLLISAGIPVQLADVHIGNTYGVISNALGGIRLQVPVHNVEDAQQLLEDYSAGRLQLEDADADAPVTVNITKPPEPMPALWQPDWAAVFGIILSPLFPMLLHYLNWRLLNNPSQARRALWWLLATFTIMFGVLTYALWIEGRTETSNSLLFLTWIVLLPIWYFSQGRKLAQLMTGWNYPRKLIGLAMLIGALSLLGLNAGLRFLSTHTLTLPARVAQLVKQFPIPEQIDEMTKRIAVNANGAVLTLTMEVKMDRLDNAELATMQSTDTHEVCNAEPLIGQGMTVEMQFVDLAHQPLASYQISAKDCAGI